MPHCDPNVNLYDRLYACRGDKVEAIWPIAARREIGRRSGRVSAFSRGTSFMLAFCALLSPATNRGCNFSRGRDSSAT